jgi:hypothetical protein
MKTLEQIEVEIRDVFVRMEALDGVLLGTLLKKHNRERRKDGSTYVSPPYYTFQYQGQNGKQQWRRVPRQHKACVERMIVNGQEYVRLRKLVETLLREAALLGLDSKKNDS